MKSTVRGPLTRLPNCHLAKRPLRLSLKEDVEKRVKSLLGHLEGLLSGTVHM